ncbi:Lpp/OprI family alanine-zipper lipoprotein [Photobacterium nomapromontoriensis]|uniref:Lpp/OprI family alanine-zipper lipoprotein n=1 Tax=Photobacterium nomapromontoriensis TaxID=2910237 RepID=UPI003D13F97A
MKRSLALATGLILSTTLMGCSNSEQAEQLSQLSNNIDTLSQQVASIQAQQDVMAGAIADSVAASDVAYQEAVRANQRVDNVAKSYTK